MVMLIICAQTGSVRAQTSEPPPLHADIRAYAAADATGRDALIRRSRSHLIDRFRQLLRLAVSERAGVDDVSLPGDADTLATDFAARVERIHGFDVFAVDAATVLGLSDRSTTIRSRLHLGFFTKFHALRGSFRALGDTTSEARAQALAEPLRLIDAHLDRLALFARRHDDRDLQRFLVGIRPLVEGYRPDYGTHGWRLRKVAHAKAIATLLSEHGLEHDFRYFVAERNLAHAYLLEGQREKAGAALRAARGSVPWEELGLETKADLTSLELEFFKNRSYLEAARSAAKTLEDLLPRVEAAAESLTDPDRRADLNGQVADWYLQVAYARAATGLEQRAHDLLVHASNRPGVPAVTGAKLRILQAQVCETLGDYRAGVRAAAEALELTRNPELLWQARLHQAACFALQGRVGDARRTLGMVKILRDKATAGQRKELAGRDALVAALVGKMAGDLHGALASCERSIEAAADDPTSVDRVRALWFKSGILLEIGETSDALDTAYDARAAAHDAKVNARWQLFVSDLGIADILLSSGRAAEASRRLGDALKSGGDFLESHPALRGEARRLRAEAQWRLIDESSTPQEETKTLLRDLDRAIDDLKAHGRGRFGRPRLAVETLRAYELVFEIELARGNRAAALNVAEDARSFTDNLERPAGRARHLAWSEVRASMEAILARAAEARGEAEQALHHYKKAARLESAVRRGLRWRAPDGLSARFEGIHDRMSYLHLAAASSHNTAARVREALLFLEGRRAQSLRALIGAAELSLAAAQPAHQSAEDIGLDRPRGLDGPGLDRILTDGRAIIVYSVTARGSFVIALRKSEAEVHRLTLDRIGLERFVHSLRSNMRGEPDRYKAEAVLDFGYRLYKELISPVAHIVKDAREIVIVRDGVLHAVPFAALVTEDMGIGRDIGDFSNVPFLCTQPGLEAISIVPSLATLSLLLDRPTPAPTRSALLIGDPALANVAYPSLPHARREIAVISELLDEPDVLIGRRATRRAFDAAKPGQYGIVHIAAHTRRGRLPSILLAPGKGAERRAELSPSDVMGMKLDETSLVVLSACDSGRGRVAGSEGLIGLPRAFLVAGARRVLASSLDVVDERTSGLMKLLYAHMRRGDQPARALLRSQRSLLKSPGSSWPGFWAPFFIVGAP